MTNTETQTKTATARKSAPVKEAPAAKPASEKAATANAAAAPASAKLRWSVEAEHQGGKTQSARLGVRLYEIKKTDEGYRATVTVENGKPETLSDTTFAKAYGACVQHGRAQ